MEIERFIMQAAGTEVFPRRYDPDFSYPSARWVRLADGWLTYIKHDPRYTRPNPRTPDETLDIRFGNDGNGMLFCGRAAERALPEGPLLVMEDLVAGLTTRFLYTMGQLYDRAGYLGPVDVGVAVTNLKGDIPALSRRNAWGYHYPPYDRAEYRRTSRVHALGLAGEPQVVAANLILPLVAAVTQEQYDPFAGK